MEKSEKLEQRCGNIGRKFFAFLHKKASVLRIVFWQASGYVTRLADMNNYLTRLAACSAKTATQSSTNELTVSKE